MKVFGDFDLSGFWYGGSYERKEYVGAPLDDALVRSIEQELGHRLPASYIELMKVQNGGLLVKGCHPTRSVLPSGASYAEANGIYAIDRTPPCSLGGSTKTAFWVRDWGYPDIGIYFADCPSAGHEMICLDYRGLTPGQEPAVVHVDQEDDCVITPVAPNFESFIRGLKDKSAFPD